MKKIENAIKLRITDMMVKKKYLIRASAAFLIGIIFTCVLFVWFNQNFPRLTDGRFSGKTVQGFYYPDNMIWDDAVQGYTFQIDIPEDAPDLCMILSGVSQAEVLLDHQTVESFTQDSVYRYNRIIGLPVDAGLYTISLVCPRIEIQNPIHRLLAGKIMPSVVICPIHTADHYTQTAQYAMCVLLGIFLMMFIGCIALYAGKTSEKYLLVLAAGLFILSSRTLLVFGQNILEMTEKQAVLVRTCVSYIPVTINAIICYSIFCEEMPVRRKLILSVLIPCILNIIDIILGLTTKLALYQFHRRLMWLPMIYGLGWGMSRKRYGAYSALVAYALSEGTIVYLFFVNNTYLLPYDPIMMFTRLSEYGHMLLMLTYFVCVYVRYGNRFGDADRLTLELKTTNEHLEELVEERTCKIREVEEQRKKMMLNTFHDLRSPIFVLNQSLDRMDPDAAPGKDILKILKERTTYLSRLTEDLFLIAKLENNEIIYDEGTVILSDILTDIAAGEKVTAEEKGIDFKSEIEDNLKTWGDAYRIRQALQNLADNAVKYTSQGGKVTVTAKHEDSHTRIAFADTGKGIPRDEIQYVFNRYYTTNYKRDRHSTGLGLAIAREIIVAHGGSIKVESDLGKGSVFIVDLPDI